MDAKTIAAVYHDVVIVWAKGAGGDNLSFLSCTRRGREEERIYILKCTFSIINKFMNKYIGTLK